MMTKKMWGLFVLVALLSFSCGNSADQGGDDSTGTKEDTEETAPGEPTDSAGEIAATEEEPAEGGETAVAEEPTPQREEKTETTPTPPPPSAPKYQRIAYRPGTTAQISGSIKGTSTREYISELPAAPLTFKLVTDNSAARLMVTDTRGKRLSSAGQEVTYTAPSAGDYLIKVFMNMGDAASSQTADYRLQIKAAE